jgi:glycolate dehydrogenase FAD-binding subunit
VVDGGVTLGDLGRTLAERGQMLALDPPDGERCTVAEAFSSAITGPRAHGYGAPRDLVLGVALRLPGGSVVHGGGRVVKNVAGYDLPRLVTGSAGRIGEIVRACLRLHPLPAATRTVVAEPSDPVALEPLRPACVEYAWPPGRMLVRFESPAAAELAETAQALLGGEIVADDEPLWAEHRELAAGLPAHRFLAADVPAAIGELRASGATRIVGRLARGILHADVKKRGQTPIFHPLEQRIVEAFGG